MAYMQPVLCGPGLRNRTMDKLSFGRYREPNMFNRCFEGLLPEQTSQNPYGISILVTATCFTLLPRPSDSLSSTPGCASLCSILYRRRHVPPEDSIPKCPGISRTSP